MATVRPFRATRPRPDAAGRVASVPYDIVDTSEARSLAAGNEDSFLHVVRPEIDLPEGQDLYAPIVYEAAASSFRRLVADDVLRRDPDPALYLYRQTMGKHSQIGVVACCSVDEYDDDTIKKHEKTRPDKEDDRTRHALAIGAHVGPVFLTYRGQASIDALVAEHESAHEPIYDVAAEDGVRHTVWRVAEADPLAAGFASVPALYVADGHHRSKCASRVRETCRDANPGHDGTEPYNAFLAVLFPADQLRILPYNRVVHDLGGRSRDQFLERLAAVMRVAEGADPTPARRGTFSMYLDGRWYSLRAPQELTDHPDPVASLDASILQTQILEPLLGIEDPRTAKRIDFVGGIRGTDELERRVAARPGSVAFSLYPVSVEQLLDVSDAGLLMPPKSTWFEPKLRSGLLTHEFADGSGGPR